MNNIEDILGAVVNQNASDIHLSEGRHPSLRVSGTLVPLVTMPVLSADDTKSILKTMVSADMIERFESEFELDFSYVHKGKERFRGNAFIQQGKVSIAMRLIPKSIRTVSELHLRNFR